MEPPSIAVIIPVRDGAKLIHRQLAALKAQSHKDFEIVVSDNGSTDDTVAVVQRQQSEFKSLRCVDSSGTPGVAHARNVGIASTEAEIVLICDADDAVSQTWVEAHVDTLREFDASTGPLCLTVEGELTGSTWFNEAVPVSLGHKSYSPGCNMGFRKAVLNAVGPFDETLRRGQEDVDYGWRLVGEGFTIGHSTEAAVAYEQRPGMPSRIKQQFRYGRALVDLYSKHADAGIRNQSLKWRARWWLEFGKQVGRHPRRNASNGVVRAAFQAGRIWESARQGIKTPMN